MHISTQQEYFNWIETVINEPTALPPFCDWLDENGIRSQQWREAAAFLPNVTQILRTNRPYAKILQMVTKQKVIAIYKYYNNRIRVMIHKRKHYQMIG